MTDYVLITVVLSLCLLGGAWKEHAEGNRRDSKLMASLAVCVFIGSAGLYLGMS